jgi:seryl-tRNA synthetase
MNDDDVDQILEWDPDGDPTDEQLEELTEDCRRAAMEIASERGRRLAMEVMETMEQQREEKESEEKESEEEEEFTSVSDLADSLRNVQEEYFDGPAPDRRSPNQSPQYVPRSPSHSPPPIRRLRNLSESSNPNESGPD